jgi:hypothetical protein
MRVKHFDHVIVEEYPFAKELNDEVVYQFRNVSDYGHTNVKAFHTGWDWLAGNPIIERFKEHILYKTEQTYHPGQKFDSCQPTLMKNFWANLYLKGDYAMSHNHSPFLYSFAYFANAKWYDSPLIFDDSRKKVRPKEGKYVIFPGHLKHSVPKHRYNHPRITLSGNMAL